MFPAGAHCRLLKVTKILVELIEQISIVCYDEKENLQTHKEDAELLDYITFC